MKLLNLLKLYRADVFIATFLTSLFGFIHCNTISVKSIVISLFIPSILYNFVYVVNAITDIEEDKINKPERPLPSGKIAIKTAIIYATVLGILTLIFSFILLSYPYNLYAIIIPIAGIIYSLPPIRLKKFPLISGIFTGLGITFPMLLTAHCSIKNNFLPILLFVISITILKDIEDAEGDKKGGRIPITDILSIKQIIILSLMIGLLSSILFLFSDYKAYFFVNIPPAIFLIKCLVRNQYQTKIYSPMIHYAIMGAIIAIFITILPQL